MTDNLITSVQNPKVKNVLLLQRKSSERRKTGLFVVEGRREINHCIENGFELEALYVCRELSPVTSSLSMGLGQGILPCPTFEVTPAVYEKMAYRGTTEGMLAIVKARQLQLADIPMDGSPLIIVLESVEKPGNLGAVLRSADAAAATAVIVCDPLTDLYNPNLIRSSIGAVFTTPCVACNSTDCISFLRQHNVQILTAQLQDSELYYQTDMKRPTAIVMGTESTGLTNQWREAATAHIRIPMLGRLDSLNVSVSAAILLFEAVRQRQSC